uniref:Uncharacterized protein n=1 Tax=Anguilla anguilla TaxID=7936 RepID=A0A0E9XRW4_ANGAN
MTKEKFIYGTNAVICSSRDAHFSQCISKPRTLDAL